jgi:hypothetical protein
MKKQLLAATMLIIFILPLSAQKIKDVLYLKNGSIIYGRLTGVNSENYRLQTSDGSILIFPVETVEKFTKESLAFGGRKKSGFTLALEGGLLAGAQDSKYPAPFSFNFLIGGRTSLKHTISAGSGVEFFGRPFTPLFIDYSYILNNSRTTPFIFFRVGAVMPLDRNGDEPADVNYMVPKNYKGGPSMTAGTGISWANEDYETFLSFAYRYARTSYEQKEYNRGNVTYVNTLNRLEIKFGFKF